MRNNSVKNTYERKSAFHIWKVQMCTSMYFAPLTCIRASQRGHRCHSRWGHRGALSCVSWGVYQHPWPLPTGYPLENVSRHSKCPRLTTKAAKSDFIHAYLPQSRTYVYKGAPAHHQEGQRLIPRGNCWPCLTGAGTRGIYSKGPLVLPPFCKCVVLRGRCCMNQNSKPPLWVPRFPLGNSHVYMRYTCQYTSVLLLAISLITGVSAKHSVGKRDNYLSSLTSCIKWEGEGRC